jgi:folate-binding protein YgfZ
MTDESDIRAVALDDRAVIALEGADVRTFLQGLVTNDVEAVAPDRAIYAALLSPQGKMLFDFFLFEIAGTLHLDCAADTAQDLTKRLSMYKLRADVSISDASDTLAIIALPGATAPQAAGIGGAEGACIPLGAGVAFIDPRCAAMGVRFCLPKGEAPPGFAPAAHDAYDTHRIRLGIAEGAEIAAGRGLPLEAGLDDLHGIAFDKGCYVGQEVTARMKSRGLVRNRLLPVHLDGAGAAADTPVKVDGTEAGALRVVRGQDAIAMMKLEALDRADAGEPFHAGDASVTVARPAWVRLQATKPVQ